MKRQTEQQNPSAQTNNRELSSSHLDGSLLFYLSVTMNESIRFSVLLTVPFLLAGLTNFSVSRQEAMIQQLFYSFYVIQVKTG